MLRGSWDLCHMVTYVICWVPFRIHGFQVSTLLRTRTAPSAEAAPDMPFVSEFSDSWRLKVWHYNMGIVRRSGLTHTSFNVGGLMKVLNYRLSPAALWHQWSPISTQAETSFLGNHEIAINSDTPNISQSPAPNLRSHAFNSSARPNCSRISEPSV